MEIANRTIKLTTFFDSNYLARGLSCIYSIESNSNIGISWKILALDNETFHYLSSISKENWEILSLKDLNDEKILEIRNDRTYREFCWTLTAILLNYLISSSDSSELVAYVDSDCFFFSDISLLFLNLTNDKKFFIHEHNFPANRSNWVEKVGRFNVGVIGGQATPEFSQCISNWRNQVIAKCVLDPENGYCGDQMYLNEWPLKYKELIILKSSGIGAGPWNIDKMEVRYEFNKVTVNGDQLIFYHFHGLKYALILGKYFFFQPAINYYLNSNVIKVIYKQYINTLSSFHLKMNKTQNELNLKAIFRNVHRNFPRKFRISN
jgi:hypothetical protein